MSTQQQSQPRPTPTTSSQTTTQQLPPPLQTALDNGCWYCLTLWPALHVACANAWGGPSTSDKRDWFAGTLSTLLLSDPELDAEDLEVFLLQVMQDEFECNVEDESEVATARELLRLRKSVVEDRSTDVFRELELRWQTRGLRKEERVLVIEDSQEVEGEGEEWEGFGDEGDADGNVDMDAEEDGAPKLVPALLPKEKRAEPEVDDEGFTRVVGRKKR